MSTTQLVIICATVLAVVIIAFGRRLTVTFHDIKATVDRTNTAVGTPNGQGDAMTQLAALDEKIDNVKDQLEERTHITRFGKTEPESLAGYIQDYMHLINTQLTVIKGMLDLLWIAGQHAGWELPDMPSIMQTPPPQTSEGE